MQCWPQLVHDYLLDLKLYNRKQDTISTYKIHLNRFVEHLQNHPPHTCERVDILQAFRNVFHMNEISYRGYGSRRLFTTVVHTFLKWCRDNKMIPTFTLRLPFPHSNIHTRKTIAITREAIDKLLSTIRASSCKNKLRDETLIAIYAFTGIRRSEALTLRLDTYNKNTNTILLRNKGGRRINVPVIPPLSKILKQYIVELKAKKVKLNEKQFLFPGRDSENHLSRRQANNIFNKWKTIADLPENLTIHSLRSGFATILYKEGKDMLLVSKALHHRDIRSTTGYIDIQADIPELVTTAFACAVNVNATEIPGQL